MQTRRDQLQAYRFQNRRALAALVTGEPNVVEPPMRRLSAMTVSGVMIAVVVIAVFGIIGFVKPKSGDDWKDASAIVVENGTGATYVHLGDELHPVLNYSSAVLALTSSNMRGNPHTVNVDASDIAGAKFGAEIGIDKIPGTLPKSSGLIKSPWTVCSQTSQSKSTGQPVAAVTVYGGSTHGAHDIGRGSSLVVREANGRGSSRTYVVSGGTRYAFTAGGPVVNALTLDTSHLVPVGSAFINALPAGPALTPPRPPGLGTTSAVTIGSKQYQVGQVLKVSDGSEVIVLRDGVSQALGSVASKLLQTLPAGSGTNPFLSVVPVSSNDLFDKTSKTDWPALRTRLDNLPAAIGPVTPASSNAGGACAIYDSGDSTPTIGLLVGNLATGLVGESSTSAAGRADSVVVPPDHAAVVRSSASQTRYIIGQSGLQYSVASTAVLTAFGYGDAKPSVLPAQFLRLIKVGPALDPDAARKTAS